VKSFLQDWGSTLFHGFVIFGLGAIVITQNLQHAAIQLKLQEELIDVYHFNGQLTTDNAIKELQIEQMEQVLDQQHDLLREMYKELNKLKGFPPFPGEEEKPRPNRSEA